MHGVTDKNGNLLKVRAFHAGEYLAEEMEERGFTERTVAEKVGVPLSELSAILNGKKGIDVRTAIKLEGVLDGIPADYWLSLQMHYDIQEAKEELAIA